MAPGATPPGDETTHLWAEQEVFCDEMHVNPGLTEVAIGRVLELGRRFVLPTWDDVLADRAVGYLQSRGFGNAQALRDAAGLTVVGTRGTWLGNLTSFDMTKLRARVRVAGDFIGNVKVGLEVETRWQIITKWNEAVWRLELVELHRVLCGLGLLDEVWSRFEPAHRRSMIHWPMTMGIVGRKLSGAWEAELTKLESVQCEG